MIWLFVFIFSFLVLFWSGSQLVKNLMDIAKYLGWREFVVAFFIMSFAASLPNIFVGINASLQGIPELSFGEIVGGNMIDMTLAAALAVLVGGNPLKVKSRMVQTSAIFTVIIALLPWILILDGDLGRGDGLILLLAFAAYAFWLFSKGERFRKIYQISEKKQKNISIKQFKTFLKDLIKTSIALFLLIIASWGIVKSAQAFSDTLGVGIPIIGILLIGLGNALPETYFAVVSARKKRTWLILGNLMGSVIFCATLVLGIIVLISPIKNIDFSPFIIARIFLIIASVFFLISVRTDQKITKKEALVLLAIYILFLLSEVFLR
jgi:cation:H+ antiporter